MKTLDCAVATLACLALCSLPALAQPPAQSQSGFIYNGITHVSFFFDEYNNFGQPTGQGTDSRVALAGTNASWAGVLVTQYQSTATATVISADSTRTPTDAAVIQAITELHAKGLRVMLKPHVDSEDGAWRGTFQPSNVDAWFQSFTTFILHYATLAQAQGVELLCFGTEYVQLSGAANQARWDAVIAAIRNVYTGKLVYAANATFPGDEFTTVSFWDKVDLLGIDGYFPLTDHADPTLGELVGAWRNNASGEDLVATIQNFSDANQKPLIFTELGYKSVAGANTQPFNFTFPGAFDLTEQQNCYTAFYTVWSPQNSWMLGIFWWAWPVPPPAANDTDYNPRNKPAATVLTTFQGPVTGGPNFTLAANPVSISAVPGSTATSTIAINQSGGFASPVALSVSGMPAGITAAVPAGSVTGPTATVTFNIAATVPAGTTAMVTVTGTGGGVTSATTIKLLVVTPDFSLSASPSQTNVNQGSTATSTININQIGQFAGAVSFSATNLPSGVTATFSPASTTGTFTVVTFTAAANASLISSAVSITGVSGLTHSTTINLTVQPPLNDFSLSADSPTVNQGGTATGTVTVTPMGIFAGSVTLSLSGVPGGVTATFSPNPTTGASVLSIAATPTATLGTATLNLTGTSGSISHSILIHLTVNQVQNADFSVSATNVTVPQGGTGTSTVTITPLAGFSGSVSLSAGGLPSGVTAAFNPVSTTGTSTVIFTASSAAATGNVTITITGTSGSLTHTVAVTLTVNPVVPPSFALSATNATVSQGGMGTSTVTLTRTGGFTGAVALSAGGLPAGVTATFNPASIAGSATTSTSALTFTASASAVTGPATVTITGTSGTGTQTATITLTVNRIATPDFQIGPTPPAVTLALGGTATTTITVTPSGGFTGSVSLSANGLPTGVTLTFTPVTTTGASTLTFAGSTAATIGASTITITGVSGALTHTTTIALTIVQPVIGTGGVTITPVINANGLFFDDEGLKLSNTSSITALSITINVQNTGGITFSGQYNTVGGQIIQSHAAADSTITYQFVLSAGQTLTPGTSYLFDAQMGGGGTAHPTTGDTFTATYTTQGQTFTQAGHF